VIGYGSALRGDDTAGYRAACALEEMHVPGLACYPTHQLTPDLAGRMSMVSEVIFIDAYSASDCGAAVREVLLDKKFRDNRPANISASSHACAPETLLELTQLLYGRRPQACMIAIPAMDFSLGDQLSTTTRAGIESAKEIVLKRLAGHA